MRSAAALLWKAGAGVCLLVLCLEPVSADTIYLKNGKKIEAPQVVERDGRVSYWTSAGSLSLPASIVDKVVHGTPWFDPAANPDGDRAANLPLGPPGGVAPPPSDAISRAAVHDGSVDLRYLAGLESTADADLTPRTVARVVTAEYAAARLEVGRGDLNRALDFYRTALRFAPDQVGLLLDSAYLHLRRSEYSAALDLLEHAQRIAPDSPDAAKLSGWAYYGLNRIPEAVTEWKRALALRPDAEVQHALEKAERDAQTEASYREGETSHFVLRYNGAAAPDLARDVLRTLEREYQEISATLDYSPPEPIGVILYTDKTFTDITQAPSWVGALNDGRMRIPVDGLLSVNDALARVLKHELTHSFLMQETQGRCPVWLQEGIAQYMEGKRSGREAARLSSAYEQQMEISLASYETSWLNLSAGEAANAYAWSLAVVEAIVHVDGMDDLNRVLDRIAHGGAPEEALRAVLHESYADVLESTVHYLREEYLNGSQARNASD
jgi:tetratricopeptide (TPR) repeat protein